MSHASNFCFQLPKASFLPPPPLYCAAHELDPPRIAPIVCLVKEDPADGFVTKAPAIGAATSTAERNIAIHEGVICLAPLVLVGVWFGVGHTDRKNRARESCRFGRGG